MKIFRNKKPINVALAFLIMLAILTLTIMMSCSKQPDESSLDKSTINSQNNVAESIDAGASGGSVGDSNTSLTTGEPNATDAENTSDLTDTTSVTSNIDANNGNSTSGTSNSEGNETNGDAASGGVNTPSSGASDAGSGANSNNESAFSFSDGIDENGFWEGIHALDYVEMFDYNALPIPYEVHHVSDEVVQTEIDNIIETLLVEYRITDRAVALGDKVYIDFVGFIDGEEFEGGSTEGQGLYVTIGEVFFVDNFLEQLIGKMPGEIYNIEVTFPEDYFEESLSGKDAVFATIINYIIGNYKDMTDEYVTENFAGFYGWTTVDDMKETLRISLRNPPIQQYINQYLSNDVTVKSIPDQILKYLEKAIIANYQMEAEQAGMGLNEYIASETGAPNADALLKSNYDYYSTLAKLYLVIQAVAEDAGISVTEEDLILYFQSTSGTSNYSSYEEQYGLPWLKQNVLCQTVVDYILERAVLLDQ